MERVRIGNGCGFWGDNCDAPVLLSEMGQLDYLTLEYLAELTMSILALQKQKDPQAGFATDFLEVLARLAHTLRDQPNLKIITNAGGMNPHFCATRARSLLDRLGLHDQVVATVSGDDLMPRLQQLLEEGHPFTNLDTGEPLGGFISRVVSANVYLGARPIVEALKLGASIVITGRVADASLALAPAVHELRWAWDDWDRLAAGTIAGHLIECGAQATGGLWCNWSEAPDLGNVGYPIAVVDRNGNLRITKPPATGGAVNRETITEQLLYEIADPAAYVTPDVVADFTGLQLTEESNDTVLLEGSRGRSATEAYKVSIAYRDGFTASGTLVIAGPQAVAKARLCGEMIRRRLQRAGIELEATSVECLGGGDGMVAMPADRPEPPEIVLRVAARDPRRAAVERFAREFAPLVTSGPPGVTGYTTGRPQIREVFSYWPALVSKAVVMPEVRIHER